MLGHRPAAPHQYNGVVRICCCTTRRRRAAGTRTLVVALMLTAVITLDAAATAADSSARHVRQGQQGAGGAGFIAPLWASPRRNREQLRTARPAAGSIDSNYGGAHRHLATSTAAGCLWGLQLDNVEHDSQQHSSGRQQGVGWLPKLRTGADRRRAPSSLVLQAVRAVGTDVNATVGAEVPLPAAAAEVAIPAASKVPATAATKTKKSKAAASKTESASVEGKEATVIITKAGGRPHTVASRAKISAANKGKKPWNVGVGHSEETRRKIAEGARNAAKKRREKAAESLVSVVRERVGGRWVPGLDSSCYDPCALRYAVDRLCLSICVMVRIRTQCFATGGRCARFCTRRYLLVLLRTIAAVCLYAAVLIYCSPMLCSMGILCTSGTKALRMPLPSSCILVHTCCLAVQTTAGTPEIVVSAWVAWNMGSRLGWAMLFFGLRLAAHKQGHRLFLNFQTLRKRARRPLNC